MQEQKQTRRRTQHALGFARHANASAAPEATERLAELIRLADAGRLATGVLHDLANSLVALQVHCHEAIDEAGEKPAAPLHRAMSTARECARALRSFGAYVRGREDDDLADLDQIIVQARALWAPLVERGCLEVVTHCKPDTPIAMPAPLLQQVLINLVLNARDAIGRHPGAILVRGSRRLREAVVDVADDGPGLAPELRQGVFQPFITGRAGEGGTGLGLYMARRLLESHGGTLVLHRTGSEGTTFRLTVPLR